MSVIEEPDVRSCPVCGRRVVVDGDRRSLLHESPTCEGFAEWAKTMGVSLQQRPTTESDAALARAAVGDTPGRS